MVCLDFLWMVKNYIDILMVVSIKIVFIMILIIVGIVRKFDLVCEGWVGNVEIGFGGGGGVVYGGGGGVWLFNWLFLYLYG